VKNYLLVFVSAFSLFVSGCGANPVAQNSEQQKTKVVAAYTVKKNTEPIMLSATGVVEPKRVASLSFGSSGKIVSIVPKGSFVNQGQLLASLDPRHYQIEVAAASSQVQSAAVQKRETLKGASPEVVSQQRLALQRAQQSLEKAKKDVTQGEKLFLGGAISQNEYDQLKLALSQAEITVKNEEISLQRLLKGAESADIARADATLSQAASQVARAQHSLKETRLTAPFAGTVVEVGQQVGEMASPGQNVLQLVDLSELKVKLDIAKDVIYQYREGSQVVLTGNGGLRTTGKITFVSPIINEKTGKFQVEVTAANPKREWRGGMTATVEIPRKLTGVVIPLESVGISESKRYVLVIENGLVKKRFVDIGQVMEDRVEVLSGIKPGDQVIKSGITYYVEGEKVEARGE